jgi:hypothetical protein
MSNAATAASSRPQIGTLSAKESDRQSVCHFGRRFLPGVSLTKFADFQSSSQLFASTEFI